MIKRNKKYSYKCGKCEALNRHINNPFKDGMCLEYMRKVKVRRCGDEYTHMKLNICISDDIRDNVRA